MPLAASVAMSGNLQMINNKIINLANPTDNKDAINKTYVDTGFLKVSGGHITGSLILPTASPAHNEIILNFISMKYFFVHRMNLYVNKRLDMVNQIIILI